MPLLSFVSAALHLNSFTIGVAKRREQSFAYTRISSCAGVRTAKQRDVDVTLVRQNTEGEYFMLEHSPVAGTAESMKVVTAVASERVARYALWREVAVACYLGQTNLQTKILEVYEKTQISSKKIFF